MSLPNNAKFTLVGAAHRIELWNSDSWKIEKAERIKQLQKQQDGLEYVI